MIDPSKLSQMMSQAQNMQRQMQEALAKERVEGSAGGGMVKVTINGGYECLEVSIDANVVDKEDVGMLEDLVRAAINDAAARVEEVRVAQARNMAGSMGLPEGLL
jgi:DNA-binding YbaB/EbfC family protein